MSAHEELKANAAGYVLGSLEPEERRAFESHLAGCAECSAEVASLRPVVGLLATAVPQVTPRAELRDRILSALGAGAGQGANLKTRPDTDDHAIHDRKFSPALAWLPLAAAIVIAIGAAVYVARLQRQMGELQARFDQAQSTTAVLAAPDLARIDLQGQPVAPDARARALWSRSRGLVFTASNLPPLPAGRTYQLWIVTAQRPVGAGLVRPRGDGAVREVLSTSPDLTQPVAIALTIEPEGGVPAPTGDKYLVGLVN